MCYTGKCKYEDSEGHCTVEMDIHLTKYIPEEGYCNPSPNKKEKDEKNA